MEDPIKVDFLQEDSTSNKLLRQLNVKQTTSSKTLKITSLTTLFSTAIQGKGMNVNMMVDQKKLILTKLFKG